MLSRDDRNAIEELFYRLADVERRGRPRDDEAEALIRQKMAAQPTAPYYLAQTVVVQQEALKEAERRIAELERQAEGRRRGPWDNPVADGGQAQGRSAGGGFLAGAAQTALGVAGGVMLGNLIGSMFSGGTAHAAEAPAETAVDSGAADSGGNGFGGGHDSGFDGGGGFDFGGDF